MATSTLQRVPRATWSGSTLSALNALLASMNNYETMVVRMAGELSTTFIGINNNVMGVLLKVNATTTDILLSAYGTGYMYQIRYNQSTSAVAGKNRVALTAF